jgi:uncharacterized protein (DUF736 family)
MGINIGFFKLVNGNYEGKITTLLHNLSVTFERVLDRTHEKAPAFHIYSGELQIGAAWERKSKKSGAKYLGVSLEDPTFSSGYYNLYRNDGVEDGYRLVFERPSGKPKTDKPAEVAQAA